MMLLYKDGQISPKNRKEIIMRTFTVELTAHPGAMDNFSGTYEECVEWCKNHGYVNWYDENGCENENGAKICEIEEEDGCFTFC